jgi:hypothetical protein
MLRSAGAYVELTFEPSFLVKGVLKVEFARRIWIDKFDVCAIFDAKRFGHRKAATG